MRLGIGSVELGPVKTALLRVAAKANGESLRTRVAKILEGHLARFGVIYNREVSYLSRLYGISWEEAFVLLASDRPSPLKSPWTKADLKWAANQVYLVRREDLGDGSALGIALPASIYAELERSAIPADVAVAVEEGLRAGLRDRSGASENSAYALGRNLAVLAIQILEGGNGRSDSGDQRGVGTGNTANPPGGGSNREAGGSGGN